MSSLESQEYVPLSQRKSPEGSIMVAKDSELLKKDLEEVGIDPERSVLGFDDAMSLAAMLDTTGAEHLSWTQDGIIRTWETRHARDRFTQDVLTDRIADLDAKAQVLVQKADELEAIRLRFDAAYQASLSERPGVTVHVEAKGQEEAFDYSFQSMQPDDEDIWADLVKRASGPFAWGDKIYKVFGVFYSDSEEVNSGRFFWSDNVYEPIQLVNATRRGFVNRNIGEEDEIKVDDHTQATPTIFEIRQRNGQEVPSIIFWASDGSQAKKLGKYFGGILEKGSCIIEQPSL